MKVAFVLLVLFALSLLTLGCVDSSSSSSSVSSVQVANGNNNTQVIQSGMTCVDDHNAEYYTCFKPVCNSTEVCNVVIWEDGGREEFLKNTTRVFCSCGATENCGC